MTSATMTLPMQQQAAKKPCGCGCADHEQTCCGLDCLTKPRFFCGQLLTDQDMTALVGWTQNKLALSRFRHGWGVVCGLDVRCDPMNPASVMVTPGYAVSCCGEDIVVCKEYSVDLSGLCTPPKDNCAQFGPPPAAQVGTINFGGLPVPENEVRVVDLFIRYKEDFSDPHTALGRGVCHQTTSCEFTRIQESFRFAPELTTAASDPVEAAAASWLKGYYACLDVIDGFSAKFPNPPAATSVANDIREWLLNWIGQHHLGEFCFVRDWICSLSADKFDQQVIVRILFWLVQDCRNQYLHCDCAGCVDNKGVALARIWLRARGNGRPDCRVLRIDAYPPYRRNQHLDCWPAPLGSINLGQVMWHRVADACSLLARLGVDVGQKQVEFPFPATVADLRERLRCTPFLPCGDEPVLQYYKLGPDDWRIVGFCGMRPQILAPAPAGGGPAVDDLTLVAHIKEKRAQMLRDAGITSYEQMAGMTPESLHQVFPQLAPGPLQECIDSARDRLAQKQAGTLPEE